MALVLCCFSAAGAGSTNIFHFRTPREQGYRIDDQETRAAGSKAEWLKAWATDGSTNCVKLGSRVVLQLDNGGDLKQLLAGRNLKCARVVNSNIFILQAPDAWTAAREAQALAQLPGVVTCHPVMQRPVVFNDLYAPAPQELYFSQENYIEARTATGSSFGVDMNARAAWPYTRGVGITLAVADTGVEMVHPDLTNHIAAGPHFNFFDGTTTNVGPVSSDATGAHGTEVSGLALAQGSGTNGMTGVAPAAQLASWVITDIINTNGTDNQFLADDEQLMDMFQYASNTVSVQNHSWSIPGLTQNGPGTLEQIGISNAIAQGRSGQGVVMVRAGGNDRLTGGNANDNGYAADPRVVAVGAVRIDGVVASYSDPGACLLVSAPGGDPNATTLAPGLFTTDEVGSRGVTVFTNFLPPYQNLGNYVYVTGANSNSLSGGFAGTSAATPQISGVAALLLSVNPNLTYRDVQQILLLSARHYDFADPDVVTNGAGFIVSHNLGFGVPDAGAAVALARAWTNRPPLTNVVITATNVAAIPDAGLQLVVTGTNVPGGVLIISNTLPSVGPNGDTSTPSVPLVDFGFGTNTGINLTNSAALIQRGAVPFSVSLSNAAVAGAVFGVIYNDAAGSSSCGGGDMLCVISMADFVPIPALFIGETDGENLLSLIQGNSGTSAQIQMVSTNYVFNVTNTLICEQVGVRLQTDHQRRGDLRISLLSPMGTRSVLQRYNDDSTPGPADWTYWTTHNFYESSAGNWTLTVTDESLGETGSVLSASLIINGVPITDTDHDGLDDNWELKYFGSLAQGPKDDPANDGYDNARKQVMGLDPRVSVNVPFALDITPWSPAVTRVSWPSSPDYTYQVWGGTNLLSLNVVASNLPGAFPVMPWFAPSSKTGNEFYRVRATLNP